MKLCPNCGKELPVSKKKEADPRIKEFVDFYYQLYQKSFAGKSPTIHGGKDAMAIKRILVNWSLEEMKNSLPHYLYCQKAFYIENGYDITRFEKYMATKGVDKNEGREIGGIGGNGREPKSFHQRDVEEAERVKQAVRTRLGVFGGGRRLDNKPNEIKVDGGREIATPDEALDILKSKVIED